MAKKIRIPAKRADRSVRWTLEVSADTHKAASASMAGKRKATAPRATPRTSSRGLTSSRDAKPAVKSKAPRARTPQPAAAIPPLDQSAPIRMRPTVLAMAAGAVVVVVALVFARDASLRASGAVNGPDAAASAGVPVVPTTVHIAPTPRVEAPVAVAPSNRTPTPAATPEKLNRVEVASSQPIVPPTSSALRPPPMATIVKADEPAAHTASVEPSTSPMESKLTVDRVNQSPVTITGCLEVTADGDQFRLTDTEGDGTPKARGWRSGFLRKRPAAVELSDLRDPATARRYVGHRVVATGFLASRALRVNSLRSAGSVCD